MYAIANIIYGIPLISNDPDFSRSDDLQEFIDEEGDGVQSLYSGAGGEQPAAFGVLIGEFDEACAFVEQSVYSASPSAEHVAEFNRLWANLSEEDRALMEPYGAPRTFLLWSTS